MLSTTSSTPVGRMAITFFLLPPLLVVDAVVGCIFPTASLVANRIAARIIVSSIIISLSLLFIDDPLS